MNHINYDDVLRQLEAYGLILDRPLLFDAQIQRWKTNKGSNESPGWSRLREWVSNKGNAYIVGNFGVWSGNDDGGVKITLPKRDPEKPELSPADIEALRAAQKEAAKKLADERKAEAKRASQWAAIVWAACAPARNETPHDYLSKKGIKAHGLRVLESASDITLTGIDDSNRYRLAKAVGALVVPMHDAHGNVNGIQFIYPRGHDRIKDGRDKEFWPSGMAMGGSFGTIGHVSRTGVMLVVEGYATAASLAEATGQSVAYAFSANNLAKAAKLLRKTYPRLRLLFCADDDYKTAEAGKGNPGVEAAVAATGELEHAAWVKPDFKDSDGADLRQGKKLSDFNDLAVLTGLPLVLANQINAKLDALKWRDAAAVQAATLNGGEGEADRPAAMSVMPLDDLVARFIPVDDGSGKVLFDQWTNRIVQKTQMNELLPAGAQISDVKRHPVWITRGAVYVEQIGFDPLGDDKKVVLNTWRGWPMEPKKGKCDLLLELLEFMCSNEGPRPDVVRWILCWMAYPLQHPGAKMQSALMLHGKQGAGKSTIFKVLAEIYGHKHPYRNYSVILDQKALEAKYNSDWDSKLYVLAEEVINSSDKWQLKNELKELVTGDSIRIEKKFLDAYYQTNRCNIVFLSNEDAPLPLDNGDRRHLVIWTPSPRDLGYYADVRAEIENGGVEAFYHHLMTLDLGDFKPWAKPPMTEAKQALIDSSQSSEDEFFHEWAAGETPFPVCACRSDDLYAAYVLTARRWHTPKIASRNRFRIKLAHLQDWKHRKQIHVHADYRMELPTKQMRLELPGETWLAKPAKGKEDYRQGDTETQAAWATRSMLDFAKALEDATPSAKF